jgi:hypothetical protein
VGEGGWGSQEVCLGKEPSSQMEFMSQAAVAIQDEDNRSMNLMRIESKITKTKRNKETFKCVLP